MIVKCWKCKGKGGWHIKYGTITCGYKECENCDGEGEIKLEILEEKDE